jgi:carbon storage regulator CsrA
MWPAYRPPLTLENGGSTMLVLSRKHQESVVVGGAPGFERTLKVTVLEINGASVRLGFEGDSGIPVHRLEVWERILAESRPDQATEGEPLLTNVTAGRTSKQSVK